MRCHHLVIAVVVLALLAPGCSQDSTEEGVVARVNGEPIYLEDLEAGYGDDYFKWTGGLPPDLQEIKASYGNVLLGLIVQKLIKQHLEATGHEVDPDELERREQEIRQDYPDGGFEEVLIEEHIDLDFWREQNLRNLMWDRFKEEILRPRIDLEVEEIKEYYDSHIEDFYIPERVVFLHFSSQEESALQETLDTFHESEEISRIREKYPQINVGKYEMRIDRLPLGLQEDLTSLKSGEKSRIQKNRQGLFHWVMVVERRDSKLLKPHQVYDIIEENLVQEKLHEVFYNWLERTLEHTSIHIDANLLEAAFSDN